VLALGLLSLPGPARSEIVDVQRLELQDGIAHYVFDVDLGPEEFDAIRLHRIVREKHEGKPVATVDGLFMLPGAPNFFEMIFLPSTVSEAAPWDHSIAVFLAKNDIDVWGMDYAWALVPLETSNFDFMEGWGLEREIGYAEQALDTVRSIRRDTGQGNRRLQVLGFSYGGPIAYAMAANETLLPPGQRRINGIIAADAEMKVSEAERAASCASADKGQARIDDGDFANPNGIMLATVGTLAEFWPDEASPVIPGLNNWQVALLLGAVDNPTWHFVAGEFNAYGIPTGLAYTDPELWIDLLQYVPPYVPRQTFVDMNTTWCDEVDVPFDDYLADVEVPILAVGAAGGAVPEPYTPWLTASRDIEQLTVQFLPDELHMLDFGHGDLFMAGNAEAEVWRPILDWLVAHRAERTYP